MEFVGAMWTGIRLFQKPFGAGTGMSDFSSMKKVALF